MTSKNRRNYYRILFVQPDAPAELIKASYRTLMGPLKRHPDLGGDHETASLINEAYQVLSDPVRREAYARTYRPAWARTPAGGVTGEAAWDAAAWVDLGCCPFCRAALPRSLDAETRCQRCACPLTEPIKHAARGRELLGRRITPRVASSDPAILYRNWQAHPVAVRMRDHSLGGLSLYASMAIPVGTVVRIVGARLDAVALVVSARRRAQEWLINARLLTMRYPQKTGVFVADVA